MNWLQQFKQRVERENPQPESTPQSDVVFVRERQSDPTPPPKAASTDQREVSQRKRTEPIPIKEPHTPHAKTTQSWIYSMPDDASDFEWWVEFIANCETHPLKSYENAQRVEEVELL